MKEYLKLVGIILWALTILPAFVGFFLISDWRGLPYGVCFGLAEVLNLAAFVKVVVR